MAVLIGTLVIVAVLFGVLGLMFGLARLLSSFGKPESRWKRYAAVMVPTVSVFTFVIFFCVLNAIISFMLGIDPLGDYEVPLRHRYTLYAGCSSGDNDVLDGKNCVVVACVSELYMDGNMLYGRCVDDLQEYSEGFALDMHSGKCEPAEVDILRLKPVDEFCKERERKVSMPLGWLAVLVSAVVAFLAGWRYIKIIRGAKFSEGSNITH